MAAHYRHRGGVVRHRHRVWPWIIGAVLVIVVATATFMGFAGMSVYKDAKQVQQHENRALSMLSSLSVNIDDEKIQEVDRQLPAIQRETSQANEISHGRWWEFLQRLPYIGPNIETVQGMTTIIDNLSHQSIPDFLNIVSSLQNAQISSDDGINLKPIIDAQSSMQDANNSLQKQVAAYNNLPSPTIEQINAAYVQGSDKINALATRINALANTFRMLPGFLGEDHSRTYAVMSMTTSEMRSSGGLIGSVGDLTTDNGSITVGEFKSNVAYLPYGAGDHSVDEKKVFTDDGPLHMSFDVRDTAVFPQTERAAFSMRSIWDRTPWGQEQPLDGVIMLDPVFVQQLVAINGDVTLEDGTVLTGKNTAEFLLNTIYQKYNDSQTDSIFGAATEQIIANMFKDINIGKLVKIGEMMGTMAEQRHFTMYSFDDALEKEIQAAGFTGDTPNDPQNPSVGVYITEQNPSKMGWYIHRTSAIEKMQCGPGGDVYHVEYTLDNTMKEEDISNLPWYITGVNEADRGNGIEKILFYPPAGGRIDNIAQLNASANSVYRITMDGKEIYETVVYILPGQQVTFSFDVTVSPEAKKPLTVDQTPLGWEGTGITIKKSNCRTN